MPPTDQPTVQQLAQQVKDLQAANAALLECHSSLSIAYMAMRVSELEKGAAKHTAAITALRCKNVQLEEQLDKARRAWAVLNEKLKATQT